MLVQNGLESNRVLESLAALGCTVGIEEALLASEGSAVAVANAIAVSESGRYVPVGGVTKIIESLTRSIMESDGMVLKNVEIKRMDIEEMLTTTAVAQHGKMPYKAVGVTIAGPNSTASTTTDDDSAEISIQASKSIVSGLGYLSTYTTLLPAECVSPDTRQQLDNLKESRPKLKVALWLQGQAEELGLTSTDYFEIGNPVPVAVRSSEENEGKLAAEHLALSYIHVWSPSMQDQDWTQSHPKDSHVLIVEFEVTEPLVYLETDRTFSNQSELFHHGPKFYCTTRESESNPNHAKFASKIGRPLNISISKQQEYLQKAESIVATLFPKTVQKVSFKQLVLPYLGGHRVANNTAKFECNLSATTEVQVSLVSSLYSTIFEGFIQINLSIVFHLEFLLDWL